MFQHESETEIIDHYSNTPIQFNGFYMAVKLIILKKCNIFAQKHIWWVLIRTVSLKAVMRKSAFCIYAKNKGAGQLPGLCLTWLETSRFSCDEAHIVYLSKSSRLRYFTSLDILSFSQVRNRNSTTSYVMADPCM